MFHKARENASSESPGRKVSYGGNGRDSFQLPDLQPETFLTRIANPPRPERRSDIWE
jgi:hypothetical protein